MTLFTILDGFTTWRMIANSVPVRRGALCPSTRAVERDGLHACTPSEARYAIDWMSILETKLREFLKSEHRLSGDDLGDDRELFSTGLLDSFAVVELVAFLEKQRGIRVKASVLTLDNFDTIAGRTEYVSARS